MEREGAEPDHIPCANVELEFATSRGNMYFAVPQSGEADHDLSSCARVRGQPSRDAKGTFHLISSFRSVGREYRVSEVRPIACF